jgi:hypothetical protein
MDESSDLGMAFGSAGETSVLMCVATKRRSGRGLRKSLSCSSRALAGDLPEGSLWSTTSNTFAFILIFRQQLGLELARLQLSTKRTRPKKVRTGHDLGFVVVSRAGVSLA